MSDSLTIDVEDDELGGDDINQRQPSDRASNLAKKPTVKKLLLDIFDDVQKGFEDQYDRSNDQLDYWDVYNCKLGGKQFYSGNSQIYVPIVHNAINARKTRFVNEIFPQSGRYVEVTSENGDVPYPEVALAEYYVRKARLRTVVMPALMRSGDIEGQYNIYVSWAKRTRHVAMKVKKMPVEGDMPLAGADDVEDIEEQEIVDGCPEVEVLSDSDVLVLPATADTINEALDSGGSVTILRRWGKAKIRQMIDDGAIDKTEGKSLLHEMSKPLSMTQRTNREKEAVDAAGIKSEGGKHALVYETWAKIKVGGERRICQAFYGGADRVLGCRRNPYWCDRVPLISHPVEKVAGVFKGQSKVKPCADMQYSANDAINMANDSAAYALCPIIMTDPEKNPRVGSMVLAMSAIWETSPQDTQFAQFPQLWKEGFELVSNAAAQITQTLSVSPAALTMQTRASRLTQAEVAIEQQIDILQTADVVTVVEDEVLTPLVNWFLDLDHQFRDDEIMVRQFGPMGIRAEMQVVPPIQMDAAYQFRWLGVEAARNAQQVQQQVASLNILRGMTPDNYPGYTLNLVPVILQLVENTFGPRIAPLVFEDQRMQLSVDAAQENDMMDQGFTVSVHPMDDDQKHLQIHLAELKKHQDPHGTIRIHMQDHQRALQMKAKGAQMAQAAQLQQQQMGGQSGAPGGPPQQPGAAGPPRMGAQPGALRNGQNPPGAIHPDLMQDPNRMPALPGGGAF